MKVFTPQEANKTLPLVRSIVQDIVRCGQKLQQCRFQFPDSFDSNESYTRGTEELHQLLRELEELGCLYKDYNFSIGLVDFPAIIDSKEVFLCWRADEERVEYFHDISSNFSHRKLIPEEYLLEVE